MESQTDIYIANVEITNKYFIKKSNTKTKKQTKDSKSTKPKKSKGGARKGKTVKKTTPTKSFKTMMSGDKLFENPDVLLLQAVSNDILYEIWIQSITNEIKTHNKLFVTPNSLDEIPKMMSNSAFYKHEDENTDENKQKYPKYHLSYPEIMDVYDVSQKIAETGKTDIVSELNISKKSKPFPVYVLTFYEVNDENMKFLGMVFYTMTSIADTNKKYVKMFNWDKESDDVKAKNNTAMFFFSPYKSLINDCNACIDMEIPFFNIMLKKLEKTAQENNCACIFTHPKFAMSSLRNIFLNNGYYESIYRPIIENFGESMKIGKTHEVFDDYDLDEGFIRVSKDQMKRIISESEEDIKNELDELEKISGDLQTEFEEKEGENIEVIMQLEQERLKQQEELALAIQKREELELEKYYNDVFNEFLYLPPTLSIEQMNKLQRIIFLTEMYIEEGFVHNRINTRGTGWYGLSIADKYLFDTTFKCKGENDKPREYRNVLYKDDEAKEKQFKLLEEELEDLKRNGIFENKDEKEELQTSLLVKKNQLSAAKRYLNEHISEPTTQEEIEERYKHENNERMLPYEINELQKEFTNKNYNTSQYDKRKKEYDKLWWSFGYVGSLNPFTSNFISSSISNVGYIYDNINSTFFCKNGYKFGPEIVVEKQIELAKEKHGDISNEHKVPKYFISFIKLMGEVYLPTWWLKPQYGAFDFFSEEGFSKNLREYTNAIYDEGDVVLVQTKETGELFEDYYVGVILSITNKQNKDKLQKESWNIWGTSQWNSTYEILVKRNQEEYFVVEGVWSWNLKLNLTFMYKDVTNGHVFGISSTDYYPSMPAPLKITHNYPDNNISKNDDDIRSSIPPPVTPSIGHYPDRNPPIPSMGGPDNDDDDGQPYDSTPYNESQQQDYIAYPSEQVYLNARENVDDENSIIRNETQTPTVTDDKITSQKIQPTNIPTNSFLDNFRKRREREEFRADEISSNTSQQVIENRDSQLNREQRIQEENKKLEKERAQAEARARAEQFQQEDSARIIQQNLKQYYAKKQDAKRLDEQERMREQRGKEQEEYLDFLANDSTNQNLTRDSSSSTRPPTTPDSWNRPSFNQPPMAKSNAQNFQIYEEPPTTPDVWSRSSISSISPNPYYKSTSNPVKSKSNPMKSTRTIEKNTRTRQLKPVNLNEVYKRGNSKTITGEDGSPFKLGGRKKSNKSRTHKKKTKNKRKTKNKKIKNATMNKKRRTKKNQ